MTNINEFSMPVLFKILFLFLLLNIICNFILYKISYREVHKKLFIYWFALVIVFFLQGIFQKGTLQICLAFTASIFPMAILSSLICETYKKTLPIKTYPPILMITIFLVTLLEYFGFGFTTVAMPAAIATSIPLLYAGYCVATNWNHSTLLQKFLGVIFSLMPIHCLNFAFFRMDESTQVWGWFVSWGIYQTLAVILPCFTLEEVTKNENVRIANYTKNLRHRITLLETELHELRTANNSQNCTSRKEIAETDLSIH